MPQTEEPAIVLAFIVVAIIIIVVVAALFSRMPRRSSTRADGFISLIPENPLPWRFPGSCGGASEPIAHEEEDPLLYRCQHQCATLGPVTERPGESCVEQCVWGWRDPPAGENAGTIGDAFADPWPRRAHAVPNQWPHGVNAGNIWSGEKYAPPGWRKCFRNCGMDMKCRDDCLSVAAGTAYGL